MTQAEEPEAPRSSRALAPRSAGGGLALDDRAVADVVGNFLLIGITVAMMAVLAFFVVSQPPPDNPVSADLKVAGNGTQLKIHHKWGEAVPVGQARLLIELDDGTTEVRELSHQDFAEYVDSGRGGIDADFWQIGETICVSCEYVGQTIRRVAVASGNALLLDWSGRVDAKIGPGPIAGNLPPVADFTFNPDGLNVTFNASASSDPEGGALTYEWDFGDRNTSTIPPNEVVNHTYGSTGTFTVVLTVTDVDGANDTQSKVVTLSDTTDYLECPTNPDPGEEIDCFKARNDLNSDQGIFREEDVAGTLTNLYGADQVVQAGEWVDLSNALAHDGTFSTTEKKDTVLELAFENETADPGSIERVAVTLNVSIEGGGGGDSFGVRACFSDGTCKDEQTQTVAENTVTNITFDLPAPDHHPGGLATWSWSDINDLQIRIRSIKNAGGPIWKVDHAWIEVDYSPAADYAFATEATIPDVDAGGSSHALQIRYETTGEAFEVYVWNTNTMSFQSAGELNSTSLTNWTFALHATDHISGTGEVLVRITDSLASDTTRDDLTLSYVRVETTL